MENNTKLWVVGKTLSNDGAQWEFQGVFSDEQSAIAACIEDNYFVGPAILNESLPNETVEWVDAYYPMAIE